MSPNQQAAARALMEAREVTPARVVEPFTFAQAVKLTADRPVFVQVRLSGSPCCARVRDSWIGRDGTFLWSLDLLSPFAGLGSFPAERVRQCSGVDGACLCAGETGFFASRARGAFSQAGVVAPPESLIFEKTPVGGGVAC